MSRRDRSPAASEPSGPASADDGPVFAEPWQAQAFALALTLSHEGHFSWKEWSTALAQEIRRAEARGEPNDGSRYYDRWLATLERLVTEKKLSTRPALRQRKAEWARAYRRTPHGRPVELAAAQPPARAGRAARPGHRPRR